MNPEQQNLFLISAALDAQAWDAFASVPTIDRYSRALSGEAPLSDAEKRQLWRSPAARANFFAARQEQLDAIAARLATAKVTMHGARLAADTDGAKTAYIQTVDFTLTLQQIEDDSEKPEWLIILTLGPRFLDQLPEGTAIRVFDTGGRTWLTAPPDGTGVVSGFWPYQDSPIERLRVFAIHLEPA